MLVVDNFFNNVIVFNDIGGWKGLLLLPDKIRDYVLTGLNMINHFSVQDEIVSKSK